MPRKKVISEELNVVTPRPQLRQGQDYGGQGMEVIRLRRRICARDEPEVGPLPD
jgi:hypothetical protein